ncbi:MAG TPA: AI-2E family transporter [Microlunatus sp.]|nr:AI-2E family transporter [Microlunatus sp.]
MTDTGAQPSAVAQPGDHPRAGTSPRTTTHCDETTDPEPSPPESPRIDRAAVIGTGVRSAAAWSAQLLIIGVALAAGLWLVGKIWVIVFPVLLALLFSSVLWPLVTWARRRGWPSALAASVALLGLLGLIAGVLTLAVRPTVRQAADLGASAGRGIQQLRDWLARPPLAVDDQRIDEVTTQLVERLQRSAEQIAAGVFTGVSAVTSGVVTLVLVLVLSFLFLKDGAEFLPWLRRQSGPAMGTHLTELLARVWLTLGRYIRVQALVSLADAILIGLGLVILQVPLAPALAVLTFFAGFIPIVGAVVAGSLAVLVALVSNGPTTALLVIALVILVQQIESNILQPLLQGRSLHLHAAVVLLAVAAGGTLFGIAGAFLAVPVAAIVATVLRYLTEQTALRSGEVQADQVSTVTAEGDRAAKMGERAARWFRSRQQTLRRDR